MNCVKFGDIATRLDGTYDIETLKLFQASHGGPNGKLVIVSLNLVSDSQRAAQFAQSQGMTWTQLYLGEWSQTTVPGMFGLNGNSGAVLIDPRGRVSTGTLRGSTLRNTLSNLLE